MCCKTSALCKRVAEDAQEFEGKVRIRETLSCGRCAHAQVVMYTMAGLLRVLFAGVHACVSLRCGSARSLFCSYTCVYIHACSHTVA